jgi:hypothetical protein
MAVDVEQQLTDAFEAASQTVAPASDLASVVRRRVGARRRITGGIGAGLVIILGTLIGIVATSGSPARPGRPSTIKPPRLQIPLREVNSMAVGGGALYVASGDHPGGALTAYDDTTGHRIASVRLPARPASVAVGANGSVWVTFYPSNLGGRSGVSEFSPDLSRRATVMTDNTYLDSGNFDVLPTGRRSALLATDAGVVTLRMPALGNHPPVAATASNASIDRSFVLPTSLARLPHRNVAVLLSNDGGQGRVVRLHGTGGINGQGLSMAGSPSGLWVASTVPRSLRFFSPALKPEPVSLGSHLAHAVSVWTSGHTVWAETGGQRLGLVCFAFRPGQTPRPVSVPLPRADSLNQTYPLGPGDLNVVPTPTAVYVAGPSAITSYPVPAACA